MNRKEKTIFSNDWWKKEKRKLRKLGYNLWYKMHSIILIKPIV